ncbi:MAG: vitamin K epoxide reductase family protein [Thermodesulfobacteriota bacterium]
MVTQGIEFKNKTRVIILIFSALGIAVSLYLTYLYFSNAESTFCLAGSGCDTVRESPYSEILGISISLFGVIGYLLIFALSLISISYRFRWILLYFISLAGFTFSLYLTYIELFVIKAICDYCLASAFIITVILIMLLLTKPKLSPKISYAKLITLSGIIVVFVLFSSFVIQSKELSARSNDTLQVGLAKHLRKIDAAMYGTYWCPHCNAQKELFGGAFKYIKYVECDSKGDRANPALCDEKGIRRYPTWEIKGRFYQGAKSLQELSQLSGYVF